MGSNQYNIKYSSMDQFYVDVCTKTQDWYQQLDSWKTSYTSLINMTSFNGQSATAVKSYLGEVHEFLLQSIYVAITRFQADYLLYKNKYYTIEDNIYATMSRETIKSIESKLNNEVKYLNNISNEIDRSLNSISDIYWRGKPSKEALEGYLNSEKNSLVALNNSIENYENNQYAVANGELKSLLETLKSTVILYSGSTNSVLSYKSGDLINKTQVLDLYNKVQSSVEYVENNKEEIELAALNQQEVFSQMQKDYEEALEAREDEGRVKVITGTLAVLIGGAAIFLTAGAATPIVVTAAVAGTGSMVYGASNIAEGKEDIYYASIGDLNSVAINPIRDTIFMGNQGAYDLWGTINMTVAGLCIPVSQSVNGVVGASKATIAKTAAMRIGRELIIDAGIDFASGNITRFAAGQFNLNKTESTLLNLGLSFGLDKSVDSARSKILGESSFAEGMSYDDAKRYNDFWKQVESGNNTGYPGLSNADIKAWKFADTKLNERIALNKIDPNEVVKLRMETLKLENSLRVVDEGVSKASKNITNIITDNGLTVNKFNELRVKNTALLTDSERSAMKAIRDSIAMPDNTTTMQKVIPNNDISKYLDGSYTQVGGYVTKYDDVSILTKYDDIYESLRLDYPGTAYKIDSDSSLGVIRFKTPNAEKFEIPYGVDFSGTITDAPPFTGNGFTKAMNDNIIPEFRCNSFLDVYDGAKLYELGKGGKEVLRAVFDSEIGRFVNIYN